MAKSLLLVPSVSRSNGTGHLKRMIKLARELSSYDDISPLLFLGDGPGDFNSLVDQFPMLKDIPHVTDLTSDQTYDVVILDKRETTKNEWLSWEKRGPVIAVDEGGAAREYASFLIDVLPNLSNHSPNIKDLSLLGLAKGKERDVLPGEPRFLISFGGEDPKGLTKPALKALVERGGVEPCRIGVVQGPLMKREEYSYPVTLYRQPESLEKIFEDYHILIGSYGLTPLEAINAGCRVILINPTFYHEKLSRSMGLPSAGVGLIGIRRLPHGIQKAKETPSPQILFHKGHSSLATWLHSLGEGSPAACPFCGYENNKVKERFLYRSYYHCRSCLNIYMVNWMKEEEQYDRDYFFSKYKEQYGKTYLDDFKNIKIMGHKRLDEIDKLMTVNKREAQLTDLGCAFGPFLSAARDRGFLCRGVEVNKDGALWVQENLGIPVLNGSIHDPWVANELNIRKSHVITLWYVIEHVPDQIGLMNSLGDWLFPEGLLAFSTPSGQGISKKRSRRKFFKSSPKDHYVIYTPRGVRRFLNQRGFIVKKIKNTGHHPERFGKWVGKRGSISYNTVMLISRLFRLGDGLEVYAVKCNDEENES